MKFVLFALISFSFLTSHAAYVMKVKKRTVLVNSEGQNLSKGQLYYLTKSGKKVGIIRIAKIKGSKALARLLKGKASPNLKLVLRKSKKKKSLISKSEAPSPSYTAKKRSKYAYLPNKRQMGFGAEVGFGMNSSTVKFFNSNGNFDREDSYSGMSLSFNALFDFQVYRGLFLRTKFGMYSFLTEDTKNQNCFDTNNQSGATCTIDLSYFNFDIIGRYYLTRGWSNFWLGGGASVLFSPSVGETTALNPDDIQMTTLILGQLGMDIKISEKLYVPITFQYSMFPSSDTVSMNTMAGYAGLAYTL